MRSTSPTRQLMLVAAAAGAGLIVELTSAADVPLAANTLLILAALVIVVRSLTPGSPAASQGFERELHPGSLQPLTTAKGFYDELSANIAGATSSLDLTHIRNEPPEQFGESAGEFFAGLLTWCDESEERTVRRVICVRTAAMYEWALDLQEQVKHRSRFQVRVVDWSSTAPAVNFAVVDGMTTFLALSGPLPQMMKGVSLRDLDVSGYFLTYYEVLWNSSTDLEDWLQQNSWEGAT